MLVSARKTQAPFIFYGVQNISPKKVVVHVSILDLKWGKWPEKEFEQHRCFQDLESLLEGTPLGDESLTLQ